MGQLTEDNLYDLQEKVDEVKAITRAGESPFRALSYLKTSIKVMMDKLSTKEKEKNYV